MSALISSIEHALWGVQVEERTQEHRHEGQLQINERVCRRFVHAAGRK
jgi:hypothetical protein